MLQDAPKMFYVQDIKGMLWTENELRGNKKQESNPAIVCIHPF